MPEIKDEYIIIQEKAINKNTKCEYLYILKINKDTYTFGKIGGVPFTTKKKDEIIEKFKNDNSMIRVNSGEKCNFMGVLCLEKNQHNYDVFLDSLHNCKGIIEIEGNYFKAKTSKNVFMLWNEFYEKSIENGLNIK